MVERRDLPLFRWGEELRRTRRRRKMLRRRTLIIGSGLAMLVGTIVFPPRPLLVWNASASAPLGLYAVNASATASRGDFVVARMPAPMIALAAERHYLPSGVLLVKRVAAVAGDRVCAYSLTLSINGVAVAKRQAVDRHGRPLPLWEGCRLLGEQDVLLLMAEVPDSFDGRYFGVTNRRDIIGKAALTWAR